MTESEANELRSVAHEIIIKLWRAKQVKHLDLLMAHCHRWPSRRQIHSHQHEGEVMPVEIMIDTTKWFICAKCKTANLHLDQNDLCARCQLPTAPGPSRDAEWCREFLDRFLDTAIAEACEGGGVWDEEVCRTVVFRFADELTDAIGGRGEWLPIETAPKDGLFMVLIAGLPWPASGQGGRISSNAHGWVNEPDPTRRTPIEATHWQPLPAAPTEPAK